MDKPTVANTISLGALSYFTRHKTAANLLLVVMVVLGLVASQKIRSQFLPDVIVDSVSVTVTWDGAGPEDVDSGIVALLEPALLNVEGVEHSNSSATEGRARIWLEFEPNWDMARAADDVNLAVESVPGLPEDADDPVVRRGAWRDRVTDVVIYGPVSVDQLARFSDELTVRLFRAGVTRTTIRGVSAPETNVIVSEVALIRHDLTLSDVANAIGQEVDTDPAGEVAGGSARVRTGVSKRSADQIEAVVIRSDVDGQNLLVRDVARVFVAGVDRDRSYFVGDQPAVSIRIDRSDKGDAIAMQNTVQRVADDMQLLMPEGVRIELIRTRAEAISDRLAILLDNGLIGLALVVGLLFLFLNARAAFWVAAGIPVAMLATIALMLAFGLTINMVSLFALIITLGIVVDDAIVVGEHADFRMRRLGETPVVAAENAARRMAAPVFAATITTILAFLGLMAISGSFGSLIADIPFTVIVVLTASLIECFLILPNHMSHALVSTAKEKWYDLPSRIFNRGFVWFRVEIFRPAMIWIVYLRYPVTAVAVVLLASQIALFIRGDVTWRFFNAPERGSISGNFSMQPGANSADTLSMMREMQRAAAAAAQALEDKHGTNPIEFVLAETGGTTGRGLSGESTIDNALLGSVAIELIDADARPYSSFEFIAMLQDEVRRHPLLETLSFRGWRSGPGGDTLHVQLYGADARVLKAAAEALKTALAPFPEVSALEDSLAYDKAEMLLELTPQGQALGFTTDGIGRVLRNRLNGITAASFPDGVRTADVVVRLPEAELEPGFLERTRLRSSAGQYVPLTDIVSVSTTVGFSSTQRENGLRVISVSGDVSEDDPRRAEEIMELLETELLPTIERDFGVNWQMAGLAEQENRFLGDALLGYILCLIGIYLMLAWVFSSWTRPAVVMAIIPFGLVGAIWGHYLWDVPLSMFSVVGLIGMTGIIINDSIVLVSTIDEYARDRDLRQAILDGTADRLRPVLLTTLTTVLGLTPLLYESSQQAQFLKPTVITLCYGLGFGMLLVLLIVPSLLAMQDDLHQRFRSFWRSLVSVETPTNDRQTVFMATALCAGIGLATIGYFGVTGDLLAPVDWITSGLSGLPMALRAFVGMIFASGLAILAVAAFARLREVRQAG